MVGRCWVSLRPSADPAYQPPSIHYLCSSSINQGQISKQRQPAEARHDSRETGAAARLCCRCDAMQCNSASQLPRSIAISAERIAHNPPMALPLTRKPGLDAMEQSGSSKGRYCLVQPAWLVPSMQLLDLPGCWLDVGRPS